MSRKPLKYLYCAGLLVSLLVSIHLPAQDEIPDRLRKQFNQFQATHLQEKVFVHSDKDFYLAGEILWFKLYCVDLFYHRSLDVSKLAYVEILGPEGNPVLQAKIELKAGLGSGSFLIPGFLPSGRYRMRAYTHFMKNMDDAYFFQKDVSIINASRDAGFSATTDPPKYDIGIFPEGGNLVFGLESRIAIKAMDNFGKALQGNGWVVEAAGDTSAHFRLGKSGMADLLLRPIRGKSYKIVLESGAQKDFPSIYEKGIIMNLSQRSEDEMRINLIADSSNHNKRVFLVAHTRNNLKVVQSADFNYASAEFIFKKSMLGDGVSHLTIFDVTGRPICERLYFKRPAKASKVQLKISGTTFNTREKVVVDIMSDNSSDTALANLSLSVFLIDSLQPHLPMNIQQYLLLQSDLTGPVEDAGYYFDNTNPEVDKDLERLMLTQGWRRFSWENIFQTSANLNKYEPEYGGEVIRGKLFHKSTRQAAAGSEISFSVPTSHNKWLTTVTDNEGDFYVNVRGLYGGNQFILQSRDSNYRFSVESPFVPARTSILSRYPFVQESQASYINIRSIAMQVQQSYYSDTRNNYRLPDGIDTTAFYGKPDKEYLLDDYTRFVTMEEVLREYVEEVRVRRLQQQFILQVKDKPLNNFFDLPPLCLVDGVPVQDGAKFLAIDPLKIRKLDVVARRYYSGNRSYNGIISCYSYLGDLGGYALDPSALVVDYEGLQLQRQFYAPIYSNQEEKSSRKPDFRTTMFWEPGISMHPAGKQIEFYTSDLAGNFAVMIQGITAGGEPINLIKYITVKK